MNKTIFDLTAEDFIGHWHADLPPGTNFNIIVTSNLNVHLSNGDKTYEGTLAVNHVEQSEVGTNYLDFIIGGNLLFVKQIDEGFFLTIPELNQEIHFSKK